MNDLLAPPPNRLLNNPPTPALGGAGNAFARLLPNWSKPLPSVARPAALVLAASVRPDVAVVAFPSAALNFRPYSPTLVPRMSVRPTLPTDPGPPNHACAAPVAP